MIETIRIDREYPAYPEMLMPEERWEQNQAHDYRWSFGVSAYYNSLYNPKVERAWWDFTDTSREATEDVFGVGVSILELSYGVDIEKGQAEKTVTGAIDEFFRNADEWFIGPTGAEELLRSLIRGAVDLRKYAEAIK